MTLSQLSKARVHKDNEANLQTYQVGAHFEALSEPFSWHPQILSTLNLDSIFTMFKCARKTLLTRGTFVPYRICPNLRPTLQVGKSQMTLLQMEGSRWNVQYSCSMLEGGILLVQLGIWVCMGWKVAYF